MIFSYEVLGLLCLAGFWVAVLLVAADVWTELRDLGALLFRLEKARRGKVVSGAGEDSAFATCTFEQRGHALDGDRPAVDVSHGVIACAMHGGVVDIEGRGDAFTEKDGALVWLHEDAFRAGAERPEDFDVCVTRAASPRGYRREIHLAVREGDEVWVAPGFVSTFAPRPFLARQRRKWALYLAAHLGVATLLTAIVLSVTMDSWVAKLSGALCLAHFLCSPPVLRAVRAATRTPDVARRFWTWA